MAKAPQPPEFSEQFSCQFSRARDPAGAKPVAKKLLKTSQTAKRIISTQQLDGTEGSVATLLMRAILHRQSVLDYKPYNI